MIDVTTRIALATLVSRKAGLHFPEQHLGDIDRGVKNACEELSISDPRTFVKRLLEREPDPYFLETLINQLTIGETYFFREKPILDAFTETLLPVIARRNNIDKTLHIWSAGCCTGEEPYTLAILLKEHLEDIGAWKIKITATDINKHFLEKAQKGKYSAWSFRETPLELRTKYFTQEGNSFVIHPEIRAMVTFAQMNLMDGQLSLHGIFPEQIHFIFCRNVLMYFNPNFIEKTYELFNKVLIPGGWVITSSVEVPNAAPTQYKFRRFQQVTLLQKADISMAEKEEILIHIPKEHKKSVIKQVSAPSKKPVVQVASVSPRKSPGGKFCQSKADSLARRAFQKKDYGEVVRLLEKEKAFNNSSGILLLLIKAHANLGHLTEAKDLSVKLIEQNPPEPYYFYLQASILLELGEEKKAEEALRKALYLDPNMILSHFLMGNLLRRNGQVNLAHKHYRNILKAISGLQDDSDLPGSDGMTAGYIRETVESILR